MPDSDIDLLLVIDSLPGRRLARMEEFAAVEHHVASSAVAAIAAAIK